MRTRGTAASPTPAAPSWRRHVPNPTTRAAWLVVAAAGVTLLLPPLGVAAAIAVVVGVVVDSRRAVDPAAVTVRRVVPPVVALGTTATITWEVHHAATRPATVVVGDALPTSLGAERKRVTMVVPPHGRASAGTTIRPERRGDVRLHELVVRVVAPWGLATRQDRRVVADRFEVHPSFRSRREAELRLTRGRLLEVGIRSARGRGSGTDFDALREYVPGDDVRRVDWAATARTGRAIVRTYRAERNQAVLVLLDTGRTMAATVGDVPRLDHAMDAVMALTTAATRLGDRVGLLAFGADHRSVVAPARAPDQLWRVVRAMYALEPELAESDYRGAFRRTLATFPRRSLLVLCTELADEAVTETLLPALPLVLREHVLVVASVRDPVVMGWRDGSAPRRPDREESTAADAYLEAAAVAALRRRDQTVRRLRRLGATVADEPPGRLAGALVDAYLELKARGRV